jgi:histidine kinase
LKKLLHPQREMRETIKNVQSDIERGLNITNQIREYAKLSQMRPGQNRVELMDLLRGYGERYSRDFRADGIRYVVEGPERVSIQGDETQINSIFSNLLLNAKDALVERDIQDKEIKVIVEKIDQMEDKQVIVKVKDNGSGIPEDVQSEIFEPFYSTKPSSGTGLGLSVVKRLVEVYGGRIEFESRVNEGTTFTIKLPYGDFDSLK